MTVIGGTEFLRSGHRGRILPDFSGLVIGHDQALVAFYGDLFVFVVLYLEGGIIELFKFGRIRLWMSKSGNKT